MPDPIIIPLLAQPPSSYYDEATVYAAALAGSSVADLYLAGQSGINSNPQADLGLEELYGTDQPHDTTTPPLMANGLCRVRWAAAQSAYVLDAYIAGVGYSEVGRVTVWGDDTSGPAAGIFIFTTVLAAELVRWTPELAVLQVTMGTTVGGQVYRCDVYVRLGRGWNGPRYEVYPARRGGVQLGAHLRWSPYYTDAVFAGWARAAAGTNAFTGVSDDPGGTWAGQALVPDTVENWVAYGNLQRNVTFAHLRTGVRYRTYTDAVAYGVNRSSIAVAADQATAAVAGYVTARLGFSTARAPLLEAEAYMLAAGTRTSVADANAGGGNAVNDTQTTAAASTLVVPATALARLPLGKYGIWARVRVTTGGDTLQVQAAFTGTGGTATSALNSTSATYVWLYLGEATKGDVAATLTVTAYRSAGVGVTGVRVDRLVLVPTERRAATDAQYDGARDTGQELLFDSRPVPELVAR